MLKPQLEGGGGNYYGSEVAEKLKEMSRDERAAHILMERIQPMRVKVKPSFLSFKGSLIEERCILLDRVAVPFLRRLAGEIYV